MEMESGVKSLGGPHGLLVNQAEAERQKAERQSLSRLEEFLQVFIKELCAIFHCG